MTFAQYTDLNFHFILFIYLRIMMESYRTEIDLNEGEMISTVDSCHGNWPHPLPL